MVDGDAIVEKLNRSDGNSQPYTWPLATYTYACIWHIREAARICCFPHIRTYIRIYISLYPKYGYVRNLDIYYISFGDFYLLASKYISTHQLLSCKAPSLSKYLNIYAENLDLYLRRIYKMQRQYWYFFSLMAQHWFFEMLRRFA